MCVTPSRVGTQIRYLITIELHSHSRHLFLASAFESGLSPHQPGLWWRRTRRGGRVSEIGPTSIRNSFCPLYFHEGLAERASFSSVGSCSS